MDERNDTDEARRKRVRKLALVLGVIAVTFYVGFIFVTGLR